MAVHNGGEELEASIDSVLAQQGVDLELIIVDDGSKDDSRERAAARATVDSRLRLLTQAKAGLTKALVYGCEMARAPLIARQDVGDVSLPGRLSAQFEQLEKSADAVLCSTHVEYLAPRGEHLYVAKIPESDINSGRAGPAHHGSVVMRRDAYHAVGGYREAFYFAQDHDLWSRLHEYGRHAVVPETLYRATLSAGSVSGAYAPQQRALAELIRAASEARRRGEVEDEILDQAARIRPVAGQGPNPEQKAAGAYFIGACLRRSNPTAARAYFKEAVTHSPRHLRAWIRLMQTGLLG
jgi:glycosyltransferase involved in cell wall biosynthesis